MGLYTVKNGQYAGLEITTKQVSPSLIQRVMTSVEIPKRPTYEVRTASGRTQVFPMDEQAAEETPGGKQQWEYYTETSQQARAEQNNKVVNALFLLGTECVLPEGDWEELDLILGLEVPTNPGARRAHFLMTHLEPSDIIGLTSSIMRETGIDESVIQEAEDSFRNSTGDGSGSGSVANVAGRSKATAEKSVAA